MVNKWFSAQHADGKPMSWEMVITKAKKFYKDFRLTEHFNISQGWLSRFKVRRECNCAVKTVDNNYCNVTPAIEIITNDNNVAPAAIENIRTTYL